MKMLIVLVLAFVSLSASAQYLASCDHAQILTPTWRLEPIDLKIAVDSPHYATIFVNGDILEVEPQLHIYTLRYEELKEVKSVMKSAGLPTNRIFSGMGFDLHPEANADDNSGVELFVVKSRDESIVQKVFRIGFRYGICK